MDADADPPRGCDDVVGVHHGVDGGEPAVLLHKVDEVNHGALGVHLEPRVHVVVGVDDGVALDAEGFDLLLRLLLDCVQLRGGLPDLYSPYHG